MENNRNTPRNRNNESNKPIETDSSEVVRRHLEDENHEITDEDIRNVKVVGTESDEPVTTGAEAKAKFDIEEDKPGKKDDEAAPKPSDNPATPWDVISSE